jgi:hypothetical protein
MRSASRQKSPFSGLQLGPDSARITGTMKQACYDDLVVGYEKVDSVGESSYQTAPEVPPCTFW